MTPAPFDEAAQHARDVAIAEFLDLNLDQWEGWLLTAAPPKELESYAVQFILALRRSGGPDDAVARGDYLQGIASLDTSALRYFIDHVGAGA